MRKCKYNVNKIFTVNPLFTSRSLDRTLLGFQLFFIISIILRPNFLSGSFLLFFKKLVFKQVTKSLLIISILVHFSITNFLYKLILIISVSFRYFCCLYALWMLLQISFVLLMKGIFLSVEKSCNKMFTINKKTNDHLLLQTLLLIEMRLYLNKFPFLCKSSQLLVFVVWNNFWNNFQTLLFWSYWWQIQGEILQEPTWSVSTLSIKNPRIRQFFSSKLYVPGYWL